LHQRQLDDEKVEGYGGDPSNSRLPLGLCEGECRRFYYNYIRHGHDHLLTNYTIHFQTSNPKIIGDCDEDEDCADGLICFQRDAGGVPVPGCLGGEKELSVTDYCIVDPDLSIPEATTTEPTSEGESEGTDSPTSEGTSGTTTEGTTIMGADTTTTGSGTPMEAYDPELDFVGNNGQFDNFPLRKCQGDCDSDDDVSPFY